MNVQTKTDDLATALPAGVYGETVLSVEHYTDHLFRFTMTRPAGFRFRSGEFAMIGLMVDGKPIYRAYSIASPAWADTLEFFSIKVPGGPLTQHLQKIQPGDTVLMRQKSTGTLVNDALTPAKNLYMISTGTGIAPFYGMVRELLEGPAGPNPSRIHLVAGAPYTTDLLYDDFFRELQARHEHVRLQVVHAHERLIVRERECLCALITYVVI